MTRFIRSALFLVCLLTIVGISEARHDHVLKSLIHTVKTAPLPRRIYVPTMSYVAPPPYEPLPRYLTEPYSSKGLYGNMKTLYPSNYYHPNSY